MILSSNPVKFYEAFGIEKTFDLFADAGIQGVDFNNSVPEFRTDAHDEAYYRELRKYADERGLTLCQAHAPYPSTFKDGSEEKNEQRFWEIVQAIKNAAYMGIPMIVVHPCYHLDYSVEENRETLIEYTLNFFRRLIPYAKEAGIQIALENVGRVSVCSTPERLNWLYDTLNDPVFTICLDVGHCLLQGVDPAEAVRTLGHRLVNGCTHIHDNGGSGDDHTLPYYGGVNWESVMEALAEIGYRGELSYEASGFLKNLPDALLVDALSYMSRVGHYLIERFEYYKNSREA